MTNDPGQHWEDRKKYNKNNNKKYSVQENIR